MKFEVLKRSHLKRNIIIGIITVLIISAIVLNFTRAKYRVTQSIPLVNGTINYTKADLNVIAMYQINSNGEYVSIDTVPSEGYELNVTKSYCEVNGIKNENINMNYENGMVHIGVEKKGTKCYLYFDIFKGNTMSTILAKYTKESRDNFNDVYTVAMANTLFQTTDWKGTSYYFAGAPIDNWVYFGGFYWRIIRLNGDGSVRLIYNGTDTSVLGTKTLIKVNSETSYEFNSDSFRSEYVGLKYSLGNQHGTGTKSSILIALDDWYNSSGLNKYADYIDINAGFCSDRNTTSGSWGTHSDYDYAAVGRLFDNKNPSLNCNNNDILKIPIGLITADEIAFAGGVYITNNKIYYLYNNQNYWTMTPHSSISSTNFMLSSTGGITASIVKNYYGVRPVINLKSDTKFEGSGTSTDPFTVVVE